MDTLKQSDKQAARARQRREAIAIANAHRTSRSRIKQGIKEGKINWRDIAIYPPACFQNRKLAELLQANRYVGPTRCRKILEGCEIPPESTLGELTADQLFELIRQPWGNWDRPISTP